MRKLWNALLHYFVPSPKNTYRPYLLRRHWLIFFFAVVLTAEGVFVTSLIAKYSVLDLPALVVPGDVIVFTNVERVVEGTLPLMENPLLVQAAKEKAQDMAARGYFAHTGPDGKEPWKWLEEVGYEYQFAGENLAVRFEESADVVRAWMASPTHRANIIKPRYTEIGVGVAEGTYQGLPATFVVQFFGTPRISGAHSAILKEEETPPASISSQVGGAAIAQEASRPSATDSVARQALEAAAESSQSASSWVIGAVLLLVLLVLALTFFMYLEIQSHEILLGGLVVSGTALLFLLLNAQLPYTLHTQQAASVALTRPAVLLGEEGLTTQAPTSSFSEASLQTLPSVPNE